MKDFQSIKVRKGPKTLVIDNPTKYPLIGEGAQSAVFKLSEDTCVKIHADPEQAKMETEALEAGKHLTFVPKVFDSGKNFIVMEYFHAPTLKEYLRNCTYIPESIVKKLLMILRELKKANFTMLDAPLRHIFVLENEELKVIDHVNAFKRNQPVPLKLLRDLDNIFLKDSFLNQVKRLEPKTHQAWNRYFAKNKLDYKNIPVTPGGAGKGVKVDGATAQPLIGKGHQGAVYRIAEEQCVKIYEKPEHAAQEKKVLLSNQNLPFIPKVHKSGANYIVMEYLAGPNLNMFLKKQAQLSEEITRQLLTMLTAMKKSGFTLIDAPLRHIIITPAGFKLVDHVYSYTRKQDRPLELFENLRERNFLDAFLGQVKAINAKLHAEWTKKPIPFSKVELPETKEKKPRKRKKEKSRTK